MADIDLIVNAINLELAPFYIEYLMSLSTGLTVGVVVSDSRSLCGIYYCF